MDDTILGWMASVVVVILFIAVVYWADKAQKKRERQAFLARKEALMSKYNDEEIVSRIMDGSVWQGQTAEQLIDALDKPHGKDEKVLKTKRQEVWKYHPSGRDRYRLRITLDDDIVVGWDKKE